VEKGYISKDGHARLVAELHQLRSVERPRMVDEVAAAAAQGDRSENAEYIYGKKRLREIDRRTRWLMKRLDELLPIDPATPRGSRCFFGAWVEVEEDGKSLKRLRILGEDEVDLAAGVISYRSPLGRALLGREEGDSVGVESPTGRREFSLLRVHYGASL
jgi:transcription elongation factor GreB